MTGLFHLAFRYLRFHWVKTVILVLAIGLIVFLPFALHVLVKHGSESLLSRAEATPLILGEKASPLELVLNTLYFESDPPPEIPFSEVERIHETRLANAIPIFNRFKAMGFPIVGTNSDYFRFRGLTVRDGRLPVLIGEVVLGATVAKELNASVGAFVVSTPEEVFDFAGTYPLRMEVVGILEPSGTPDDRIILTDIKTTWIIAGIAHGHQDLTQPESEGAILRKEGATIVANASVMTYNEINDDNRSSYHFHGSIEDFPLTSVIALPADAKSEALLRGRYLGAGERMQMVDPSGVVASLVGTIFTLRQYLMIGALLAVISASGTAFLVFSLSLRLRKREIETMHRIGVPRHRVIALLTMEIGLVIISGVSLAFLMSVGFIRYVDFVLLKLIN